MKTGEDENSDGYDEKAFSVEAVIREIRNRKFNFTCENELQQGLAELLEELGVPHQREHSLTPTDRIDFLLERGVGIEIKIQESLTSVTRQLHRYAQCPEITHLILMTSRMAHRRMPATMNEKAVEVVYLSPF